MTSKREVCKPSCQARINAYHWIVYSARVAGLLFSHFHMNFASQTVLALSIVNQRLFYTMAPVKNETAPTNADLPSAAPPGPHPSFIQVAKPYLIERTIQECMTATGVNQLREDNIRLQGVTWIDNVR